VSIDTAPATPQPDNRLPATGGGRPVLQLGDVALTLDRPRVMGILNVTPDSFSDGGRYADAGEAVRRAEQMAAAGADIIDVGGESTRPGAQAVSIDEELERVIPVIEGITGSCDVPVSIDTSKAGVMQQAVRAGARLINDVCALAMPGSLQAAVDAQVPVCLMHMQGRPRTMQDNPHYDDVVSEVHAYLEARVRECTAAGIDRRSILVDPGIGFGKSLQHNLLLLRHIDRLADLGAGVVVGVSRKSMLGTLTGRPVAERLAAGIGAAVYAALRGAAIIRTHDVAETVDALSVVHALR